MALGADSSEVAGHREATYRILTRVNLCFETLASFGSSFLVGAQLGPPWTSPAEPLYMGELTNRCLLSSVRTLFAHSARDETIIKIAPRNWTEVGLDFSPVTVR